MVSFIVSWCLVEFLIVVLAFIVEVCLCFESNKDSLVEKFEDILCSFILAIVLSAVVGCLLHWKGVESLSIAVVAMVLCTTFSISMVKGRRLCHSVLGIR